MYSEKPFNLKTYITAIEAIAQMTYQSLYIIDYQLKKFLYISDNQLFLCGETIEEVEAQGYAFYYKHLEKKDLDIMKEIKEKSSVFIKKQPTKERLHYTISYNIYIYTNRNEKTLINQQITPLKLDNDGNIEIGLCMVSLAPKNKEYQVEIKKHKSIDSWKYSWVQHKWLKGENFELTKNEKKVMQLAKQGYGTTKIADDLKRSINTIKNYRKNIFLKLNASNISEAVAIATHYKLI